MSSPLDETTKQELREAFSLFDTNKDGKIDVNELMHILEVLRLNMDFKEGPEKLKRQIADGISMATEKNPMGPQTTISFEDFCWAYQYTLATAKTEDELVEAMYGIFDFDNNKYVSTRNLKDVMNKFAIKLTDEEAMNMLAAADYDKDKVCNKADFKKFMAAGVDPISFK